MPINRVRDAEDRPCFEFEFSRRIGGQRFRLRERLPQAWTRTQADAYDRKRSAEIYAQASGIETRRWLIDEAVACYLADRAVELKYGKGIGAALRGMEKFWKGKPLDELGDVCAAIAKALRAEKAPATVKNKLRYLIGACRYFWKARRIGGADPAAGIPMPAVSNSRQVYIDRRSMLKLARACRNPATRAAIRIAWYSGMRIAEIMRARRDLVAGVFLLDDTKNGEPRLVPMHPRIRGCAAIELGSVFKIGYHFRAARAAVGMDGLHFHDLRHSAASALVNAGVSLYTVGAILGHKSRASTGRYAHLETATLRAAIERMGRPLSSPPGSAALGGSGSDVPMEARPRVELGYEDLQSRKRA